MADTKRIVMIQPAMGPDFTKPYPFYVLADGAIDRQDFWRGDPARLIGFTDRFDVDKISLSFSQFWADPSQAEGKYAVFADTNDDWGTHIEVISTVVAFDEGATPQAPEATG